MIFIKILFCVILWYSIALPCFVLSNELVQNNAFFDEKINARMLLLYLVFGPLALVFVLIFCGCKTFLSLVKTAQLQEFVPEKLKTKKIEQGKGHLSITKNEHL